MWYKILACDELRMAYNMTYVKTERVVRHIETEREI